MRVCVTCVDEMDVNKDGKISLTEFQAGLAREFQKTEVVILKQKSAIYEILEIMSHI